MVVAKKVKEAKQNERVENNILLVFYEGSTSLRTVAAGSRSFSKMLHGHVMSSFCQNDFTVDKGWTKVVTLVPSLISHLVWHIPL